MPSPSSLLLSVILQGGTHIMCGNIQTGIPQQDPAAGRSLSRDCYIRFFDPEMAFQADRTAHAEYHDPGPSGLHGGAKTAGTVIIQIGNEQYFPAAAAGRLCSKSFRARESRDVFTGEH